MNRNLKNVINRKINEREKERERKRKRENKHVTLNMLNAFYRQNKWKSRVTRFPKTKTGTLCV